MIRCARDVMNICVQRGLKLRVEQGPPPMPVLIRPFRVPQSAVTEPLKDALRAWRLEIIQELIEDIATEQATRHQREVGGAENPG